MSEFSTQNDRPAGSFWSTQLPAFFSEPLARTTAEQRDWIERGGVDRKTIVVLITTALSLTAQHYFFTGRSLGPVLASLDRWFPGVSQWGDEQAEFARLCWWCLGQNLSYLVLPLLTIKLWFREPLAEYGAKLRGMFTYWWVYLGMYLVMLPLILLLSTTESFQHTYPFYKPQTGESLWPLLGIWELLYATQFMSLEFFFRGYVLHGTRRQFGVYSVFVMAVPYCMIHFAKPLPETLGAIAAGVILGFMSLKTRSIWMGAALHIAVAWSMDLAAISFK